MVEAMGLNVVASTSKYPAVASVPYKISPKSSSRVIRGGTGWKTSVLKMTDE
jgi:hypothetical protein